MKRCPYCVEELHEKAVVCRACARPFLRGVEELLYMGRIWTLGRQAEGYAIWNMVTGGDPAVKFPPTDRGWDGAWSKYRAAEQAAAPDAGGGGWVGVAVWEG